MQLHQSDSDLADILNHQLDVLKCPLVIDESLVETLSSPANADENNNISEVQLQNILDTVNSSLTAQYDERFTPLRNDEIIQKVLDSESQKYSKVNQQVFKVYHTLQGFDISCFDCLSKDEMKLKLQNLKEIVHELPEPRYLIILDHDGARQLHRKLDGNVKQVDTYKLLQVYTNLRNELISLDTALRYNFDKTEYLRELNTKLNETFSMRNDTIDTNVNNRHAQLGNIQVEIDRFRILIEKMAYKSSLNDLQNS